MQVFLCKNTFFLLLFLSPRNEVFLMWKPLPLHIITVQVLLLKNALFLVLFLSPRNEVFFCGNPCLFSAVRTGKLKLFGHFLFANRLSSTSNKTKINMHDPALPSTYCCTAVACDTCRSKYKYHHEVYFVLVRTFFLCLFIQLFYHIFFFFFTLF